eukprot:Mycagemm_TRINITY_DN10182_c0_g2::TRINITY_DN10182_c0_g2_i1::g.5203::m.5203 type:complete len:150 gc:universal TRINITY_DN10182_c0_g2_i1:606-157(-)
MVGTLLLLLLELSVLARGLGHHLLHHCVLSLHVLLCIALCLLFLEPTTLFTILAVRALILLALVISDRHHHIEIELLAFLLARRSGHTNECISVRGLVHFVHHTSERQGVDFLHECPPMSSPCRSCKVHASCILGGERAIVPVSSKQCK